MFWSVVAFIRVYESFQGYVDDNAHSSKFACPLCACECVIPQGGVAELQTNFYTKAAHAKIKMAANSPCEVICRAHLNMNIVR